ncbi:MAG: site-specific integrase, partial [Chloroflexota bacterium]|nr:site-specific integrase [Chloroflexota bacterium]
MVDGQSSLQDFISHLTAEKHFSNNTIAAYRNDITQFLGWLDGRPGKHTWSDITRSDVQDYLVHLKGREERAYAPSTQARKMAAIKSFFHFLAADHKIAKDPTADLVSPK